MIKIIFDCLKQKYFLIYEFSALDPLHCEKLQNSKMAISQFVNNRIFVVEDIPKIKKIK